MSTSNQAVRYVRYGLDFLWALWCWASPSAAMLLLNSRFFQRSHLAKYAKSHHVWLPETKKIKGFIMIYHDFTNTNHFKGCRLPGGGQLHFTMPHRLSKKAWNWGDFGVFFLIGPPRGGRNTGNSCMPMDLDGVLQSLGRIRICVIYVQTIYVTSRIMDAWRMLHLCEIFSHQLTALKYFQHIPAQVLWRERHSHQTSPDHEPYNIVETSCFWWAVDSQKSVWFSLGMVQSWV